MLAKSVYVLCVSKKFAACFYYDVHVIYQPGHVTVCETVTKNESNFLCSCTRAVMSMNL